MAVVTVSISVDGKEMDPKIVLLFVEVQREMNRIPSAEIQLLEPETFDKGFRISDTGFFAPGKVVVVKLRYEETGVKAVKVFEGMVVRQEVSADLHQSLLTIYLKDVAFQMTTNRKSAVFEGKTDTAIIKEILGNYPKVKADGKLAATKGVHKKMVQFYARDWDFILSRAQANGLLVLVIDGTFFLIDPKVSGSPKHVFVFGVSVILNLDMESDLRYQYKTIQSQGWDITKDTLGAPVKATAETLAPGKINPAKSATQLGTEEYTLVAPVPMEKPELTAWAQAKMVKSRMAMVRGTLTMLGNGDLFPGDLMELEGAAKAFDGITLVTGVKHSITPNGWETAVQFGLSHELFTAEPDVMDTSAAGLLPGVNGLQIGIVDAFKADEDKLFRVNVKIPAMDGKKKKTSMWARLASFDAGKGRGAFFFPEVGDEVIIGFFNDDPRQPVILGSLYNKKNVPLLTPDKKNNQKGIYTREGLKIEFDDEAKSIHIETKEKQSILISEKEKKVTVKDTMNGNEVTLGAEGILLKGKKDLIIDMGGSVKVKAKGAIEFDAPAVDTK